jgi:hypothetical protein
MGADLDADAAPGGTDLESSLVCGKKIGTGLVDKVDCNQKLRSTGRTVISVSDGLQINLIPAMRSFLLGWLALIQVFDTVTERVDSLRQMPREDAPVVVRVRHDR